jgi:hypothetical protein
MLIHSNSRWPTCVTANLWLYALRTANDVINHTPSYQDKDLRSPMELFLKTRVVSNPKHWKPFGCPIYVLHNDLQGRNPFHKWRHQTRLGLYLGMSPQHGRNVALVLDLETALVSPQFHVTFDPNFETVRGVKTVSKWQNTAGFVGQKQLKTTTKSKPHRLVRRKNEPPARRAERAPELVPPQREVDHPDTENTNCGRRKRILVRQAIQEHKEIVCQLQRTLGATAHQHLETTTVIHTQD